MPVSLQHLDLRPTAQLLDRSEIHAVLGQPGGERMPECMGCHIAETGPLAGCVEAIADRNIRDSVGLYKHKLAGPREPLESGSDRGV